MNKPVCGDHSLLQRLAEGTLADADLKNVKSHVTSCPSCRLAVTEYKQVMWDLAHPLEVELPPELEYSHDVLIREWKKEHQGVASTKSHSRSLVPAWAGYSLSWTRKLPAVNTLGSLLRRTGGTLVWRSLPRWMSQRRRTRLR